MTDQRRDISFSNAVDRALDGIREYADNGIPDALAITERQAGVNNLSGHAHSLVPLAVHFARNHPALIQEIRNSTELAEGMGRGDRETTLPIWRQLKNDVTDFIAANGSDVVSEELSTGNPQTVESIARTYLPDSWGGGQRGGGGGGTVIKRTLKLMSHLQIS